MAYLRKRRIGGGTYYYILETRRVSGKVKQVIREYLGRDPTPARLAAARRYWKVGAKRKAKGGK